MGAQEQDIAQNGTRQRIKIEVCSAKRYEMRDAAAPKGVMFILSLLTHLFGLWNSPSTKQEMIKPTLFNAEQ